MDGVSQQQRKPIQNETFYTLINPVCWCSMRLFACVCDSDWLRAMVQQKMRVDFMFCFFLVCRCVRERFYFASHIQPYVWLILLFFFSSFILWNDDTIQFGSWHKEDSPQHTNVICWYAINICYLITFASLVICCHPDWADHRLLS